MSPFQAQRIEEAKRQSTALILARARLDAALSNLLAQTDYGTVDLVVAKSMQRLAEEARCTGRLGRWVL